MLLLVCLSVCCTLSISLDTAQRTVPWVCRLSGLIPVSALPPDKGRAHHLLPSLRAAGVVQAVGCTFSPSSVSSGLGFSSLLSFSVSLLLPLPYRVFMPGLHPLRGHLGYSVGLYPRQNSAYRWVRTPTATGRGGEVDLGGAETDALALQYPLHCTCLSSHHKDSFGLSH